MMFIQKHPDAEETFYFPIVDTGEAEYRVIATRLVGHYSEDDLDDRFCVVVVNMKRLCVFGIKSEGIILCAQKKDKIEPLLPPPGSKAGDLVTVPEYEMYCETPTDIYYDEFNVIAAEDLKVDSDKRAVYRDIPLEVAGKGFITTENLHSCPIRSPIKD